MTESVLRSATRRLSIGGVPLGGGAPVVVQSMTSTDTADTDATLTQVRALADAGCDLVRVSVPTKAALASFAEICAAAPVPIVADIHFDYRLALGALDAGAAKLRINPGNIGSWDKVDAVIDKAGETGAAIRIGVNAGSLEDDLAARDDLTLPEKLVASSLRFVEHFEARGFTSIVLSAKAHDVPTTIATYRALSRELPHVPLHLGVTEAGTVRQGTIKSSVGLGVLLAEGIGDTLRVSLTADPVEEPPVAWGILECLGLQPPRSRSSYQLPHVRAHAGRPHPHRTRRSSAGSRACAQAHLRRRHGVRRQRPAARRPGPTWASPAAAAAPCIFKHGQPVRKVAAAEIVDALMQEINSM